MRLALVLLALLLPFALPSGARAEDEKDAPDAAPEDGSTDGATPATAPQAAWEAMVTAVRGARAQGRDPRVVQQEHVQAFLKAYDAAEVKHGGADLVAVGRFLAAGGRNAEALLVLRGIVADDAATDAQRDEARIAFAQAVATAGKDAIDASERASALAEVEAFLPAMAGEDRAKARGDLHWLLGMVKRESDPSGAASHWLQAGFETPAHAPAAAQMVVAPLADVTHALDAIPTVRAAGLALLDRLGAGVEGDDANARRVFDAVRAKFTLLGQPAPAWTNEHAFGETRTLDDVKGKVVLVDFWATWCPWCIRSFPAMRDLLEEYGDRGFAIVGITASAPTVFESRYDLDSDMAAKAKPGEKPQPVRRGAGETEGSEEDRAKAWRDTEVAAIETFLANHEIPWDSVMIEASEPSAKYALMGWPHGIVLDRHGRVRAFKSGALLVENEDDMAHVRELIEELLAEPAPEAAAETTQPAAGEGRDE
jgi:thiol-disulfide isomerase/thioredoxin